ncbi:MAG: VWA domain-containing protein [Bacteroidales bacterium]|nr:VWA domain-containing protein [Bacteroidales bacterium]MDD4640565.1 VWA domain-containing protein [Bacteroidales bacterium]
MFRFSDPDYLYLLILPLLFFGLFLLLNRRDQKQLRKYGNPQLLRTLMPEVSTARRWLHFLLQLTAIIVGVFMVAGPQFGSKLEKQKRQGAEVIVALDVSNSMMAEDLIPNRLEKSKQSLSRLIDQLANDKIGLIVFAGEAYTQLPITADYISAKMFLNTISTELVPTQGTAIGSAIQLALRSFGLDQEAERAIVVITDGENHEDDAVLQAQEAQKLGIKIHVIGMGSLKGAPIPQGLNNDYHKDKEGNVVITKLNEEMCQQIALAGGGVYVRADNTNTALRVLNKELDSMKKSDIETTVYAEYDEQFQALAWIVLLLLFVDMFILDKKNPALRKLKLF